MTNKNREYQDYLYRWKLVKEKEDQEVREAPFELLFKQTLSVWDISNSLHLLQESEVPGSRWSDLQKNELNPIIESESRHKNLDYSYLYSYNMKNNSTKGL